MKRFNVKRFKSSDKNIWDRHVSEFCPFSFLFYRDFMEYHNDRFIDFSLLIYEKSSLVALFPANLSHVNAINSHMGLSYGGLIYDEDNAHDLFEKAVYASILDFCKDHNINTLNITLPPPFYATRIKDQAYAIISLGAEDVTPLLSMAVNLGDSSKAHKTKHKRFRKNTKRNTFSIVLDNDLTPFWNKVLIPCLKEKHQSRPVHQLEEIVLLHQRFPEHIKQWNIYHEDKLLAGITLFIKNKIIRSQYGATALGHESSAPLDFLYLYLIQKYRTDGYHFFDMGSIPANSKFSYPKGLVNYKRELGCESYDQQRFSFTHG
jgi:hypothetical protein